MLSLSLCPLFGTGRENNNFKSHLSRFLSELSQLCVHFCQGRPSLGRCPDMRPGCALPFDSPSRGILGTTQCPLEGCPFWKVGNFTEVCDLHSYIMTFGGLPFFRTCPWPA